MASRFIINRTTRTIKLSSLKSAAASTSASASPRFALPTGSPTSSPLRRFSISRTPSELGCVQSLMPFHSAVADARMTSCLTSSTSCRALSPVLGLSGPRLQLIVEIISEEGNIGSITVSSEISLAIPLLEKGGGDIETRMAFFRVMNKSILEEMGLVFGLMVVQVVYAGNSVVMGYLMNIGISPLTLVTFTAFSTFLVLAPLSAYFERNRWPKKLTAKLAFQLIMISFAGVTLFQSLFLKGIELTSPAIATAMPNLAPGLIFIIACITRLEKVKLSCIYSRVKITGTVLCVIGALMMSLLHCATGKDSHHASTFENVFDKQKINGSLYLMAAVLVLSSNVVLQAATLGDFPAPISLCAITSIIGVGLTVLVQFLQQGEVGSSWPLASLPNLVAYTLLAGTVSGASVSFNTWAMKKKGPVLVSMFNPFATVLSVIFSAVTLGDTISLGSLVGMCIMFTGLYFVLWAKRKESMSAGSPSPTPPAVDEEKPLLG